MSPLLAITDQEFAHFQRFIYESAGINLALGKKALVSGRLSRRLEPCGVKSFADYFQLLMSGRSPDEVQTAIDLLTTNETYFFREPKHFEFLREQMVQFREPRPPRIWSAAGSSGEEAYSIAMVLEDCRPGRPWEVVASDISTRMVQRARVGLYPLSRARQLPREYLQRFCLKGEGEHEGSLLVAKSLRSRVQVLQINLNAPLPSLGQFDIVFLRNVLIYFDAPTKRRVIERIVPTIRPGGWLLVSHSETLNGVTDALKPLAPSIYQRP